MIIYKCDICHKEVDEIYDTLILYKEKLDYCRNCKQEAERAREKAEREFECESILHDSRLKSEERKIIDELKRRYPINYKVVGGKTNE